MSLAEIVGEQSTWTQVGLPVSPLVDRWQRIDCVHTRDDKQMKATHVAVARPFRFTGGPLLAVACEEDACESVASSTSIIGNVSQTGLLIPSVLQGLRPAKPEVNSNGGKR